MAKKYYLKFKKKERGLFEFEKVIVTDGRKVLNDDGDFDPYYVNNSVSLKYTYSYELANFSNELFTEIWNGGNPSLKCTRKTRYDENASNLFINVNDLTIKNGIEYYCTNKGLTVEQALIRLGTYLYQIGDACTLIRLDDNEMKMVFKNNGDYLKVSPRSTEFICEQLGIPYKKSQSMNEGGVSKAKIKTNVNIKQQFDITKEQIREIYESITEKVIAQDKTVKTVLFNIFMNQKIVNSGKEEMINSSKANIILDGPTGTGKTLMLNQITKSLSLPMVLRPIISFSTTGYKGADLNDLLISLLDASNGDLELAQRGVIVLDEFDKLASNNSDKDLVMKLGVQQELLPYISGATFEIEYEGKKINFDTSKITFIALGAFNDLREKKIEENEKKYKPSLGFDTSNNSEYKREYIITSKDYVDEGLMRELVGRFTTITATQALTKEKLEEILNKSKLSPLSNLKEIGNMQHVSISVDDDVVDEIAQLAYDDNFGARGLQTLFNNIKNVILEDLIFETKEEIVIDMNLLNKSKQVSVRSY